MPCVRIRPLTRDDAHCLWDMLYQAIHVPAGAELPDREIIHSPELAHYAADWGRSGDMGRFAWRWMLKGCWWARPGCVC